MPEPIPDTPENVAKAVLNTPPEEEGRVAIRQGLQSEQTALNRPLRNWQSREASLLTLLNNQPPSRLGNQERPCRNRTNPDVVAEAVFGLSPEQARKIREATPE